MLNSWVQSLTFGSQPILKIVLRASPFVVSCNNLDTPLTVSAGFEVVMNDTGKMKGKASDSTGIYSCGYPVFVVFQFS
jgi:hypothetical protein